MTRTFADMTPSESAECIGRWCEDLDGDLVILESFCVRRTEGKVVMGALYPPTRDRLEYRASELFPRFDLPRAWTPSGEPVPGEWEYHPAYTGVYQDGTTSLNLIGVETCSKQHAEWECADIHRDDPAVNFFPVRRYTTDWEEA